MGSLALSAEHLPPRPITPRTPREYRIVARWWEAEAARGYTSSDTSLRYARNMRWAAELAGLYGYLPWLDLLRAASYKNPEAVR